MEFGIIPNWSWPTDGDPNAQFERTVEQAETALEGRYETVWLSQHYVSEGYNHFQPMPLLGRLSGVAGEKNLGTSVFLLPLHDPVAVAEQVATLDSAFHGRLEFGVSLGYKDAEFDSFGIDKSDRVGRLIEGVQLVRRLWTEDDVSFEGRHFSVEGVSIDPKPQNVRIHVGGNVPNSVERAGRLGDGWIISGRTSPGEAADLRPHYDRGRERSGRASHVSLNRETFVAETTEAAEEAVRDAMRVRVEQWLERGATDTAEEVTDVETQVDEMLAGRFVGSPEEVVGRIEAFEEAAGVDHVICLYNWRTVPHEDVLDSIRLFSEEVVPHLTG